MSLVSGLCLPVLGGKRFHLPVAAGHYYKRLVVMVAVLASSGFVILEVKGGCSRLLHSPKQQIKQVTLAGLVWYGTVQHTHCCSLGISLRCSALVVNNQPDTSPGNPSTASLVLPNTSST